MSDTATVAKSSNRGSKPGERRGGRKAGTPNKATAAIKEIAGQYTEQAVNTLVGIMAGGEGIPAAAQVAAAKELLDRAHGKPTQAVDVAGNLSISKVVREIVRPHDTNG